MVSELIERQEYNCPESAAKYRNTKPKVAILKKLLTRLRSLEIPCSPDGWGRSESLGQWVALTLVKILLCRFRGRARCVRGKRSEEHTSELQSLMRNSYAVFCLKNKHNPCLSSSHINN